MQGLSRADTMQTLLDHDFFISNAVMETIDTINSRYGNSTVKIAAEGVTKKWIMRRQKVSPSYTTRFEDLIKVKCK